MNADAGPMERFYSITELGEDLGVTARAIRFYETKGLLSPQRAGTTRVYTHRDHGRMQIILRGKRLGFSLNQIKDYLDLYDQDPSRREQMELLLVNVRGRLAELERQREDLATTIEELKDIETMTLNGLKDLGGKRAAKA